MNNLKIMDSDSLELVDDRYSLSTINKVAYKVLGINVGDDKHIVSSTSLSVNELNDIKNGRGSIALLERACADLFFQLLVAYTPIGIRCRIKTASRIYRLTP